MTRVSLAAVASYLPERWMSAAEISDATGIPQEVVVEKFGLRGKHIAAEDEHVSDLAVTVGERLLAETGFDPAGVGVVLYFGSMWKDFPVWQVGPAIAHRLGCANAYAVEYANVSYGAPAAIRMARDMLAAEDGLGAVLAVGASRESYLLDYANERARFMINFGDGAAAALFVGGRRRERGARLVRDHGRLALTPRQGALRRKRRSPRRRPLARCRRPGGDEGAPRRGEPAQLRARGRGGAGPLGRRLSPTWTTSAGST